MTISELCKEAHKTAVDKGWYDSPRTSLELLMLVVSEISEAVEEIRNGNIYSHEVINKDMPVASFFKLETEPDPTIVTIVRKPTGEVTELADAVIRLADYCQFKGYNLEAAIKEKMEFNKTRTYRHGGKKF